MASIDGLLAGANSLLNSLTSSLDGLSSTLLGGLESKASINTDDKRMSDEIGNMIVYKKELRDYYCKKIKELKKKHIM